MVNPGTFRGLRHDFLLSQMPLFRASVAGGFSKDAIAIIQRRYFKRFPIELPMDQDPSPEALEAVDDDAPDPEPESYNEEGLTSDEIEALQKAAADRKYKIEYRKAQIQRRMVYMLDRETDPDPKENGQNNPYRLLAYKLTGKTGRPPRRKTGVNVWRRSHFDDIDAEVKRRVDALQVKANGLAGVREKAVKEMYAQLPKAEQDAYEAKAKEEHDETLRQWKAELEGPISTKPEDRQRCIQGLVRFAQPILDTICEATGWKATLIVGGPEPAHNGQLNIVSIHSGKTIGDVPMTFGRSERQDFKQNVVPLFGKFLKQCYTPAECRSRALGAQEGFQALDNEELASAGADLDNIQMDSEISATASGREKVSPVPNSLEASSTGIDHNMSTTPPQQQTVPSPPPSPHLPSAQPTPAPSLPPSPITSPRPTPSCPPSPVTATAPKLPAPAPSQPLSPGPALVIPHAIATAVAHEEAEPDGSQSVPRRGRKRKEQDTCPAPHFGPNDDCNETVQASTQPRPVKRHKTAKKPSTEVTTGPPTLSGTGGVPWFKKALQMLESNNLGPRWTALLEEWKKFEEAHGFKGEGKLKAAKRPAIIGDWIQRARSVSWDPPISNVVQLGEQMSVWWTALQPAWRIDGDGDIDFALTKGNWDCLRLPGQNGLLSVIAGLYFWGAKCQNMKKSATRDLWSQMVEDVIVVCNGLLSGT